MLQRLYIHNFRCLQNFEFKPGAATSALLIGKNGSGKSTLLKALENLQAIARGNNRVKGLFNSSDFAFGRTDAPMRLELQAVLDGRVFQYTL
ncbi:MAG: AAA family ATPase, partial [Methylococcus sp.]